MTNETAKKFIARKLRDLRFNADLKIKDVQQLLEQREIKIAENTLYGYESAVSTPTVNIFLALCDIYGVTNILAEFGYGDNVLPDIPAVVLFENPIIKLVENKYGENSKEAFSVAKYFADSGKDHYLPLKSLLAGKLSEAMVAEISEKTGVELDAIISEATVFNSAPESPLLPSNRESALLKNIRKLSPKALRDLEGYIAIEAASEEASKKSKNEKIG